MYFGGYEVAAGSLTGSATVVFGSSAYNLIQNSSNFTGSSGVTTIGSGVTVEVGNGTQVGNGVIDVYYSSGGLANNGAIDVNNGTLLLAGALTLAGLGKIVQIGGTIGVSGTLDLGKGTLPLTTAAQQWQLDGGTIQNGTITEKSGGALVYTNTTNGGGDGGGGGVLNNVTVNGTMDLSQYNAANVTIYGQLVLNGTMLIGDASGGTYGSVYFGSYGNPAGSLTGDATVVFGGSAYNLIQNASTTGGASGVMTIGKSVTVQGANGSITVYYSSGGLTNFGMITADTTGDTIYVANGSATFVNDGTIAAVNGGRVIVGTTETVSGQAVINGSSSGTLQVNENGTASFTAGNQISVADLSGTTEQFSLSVLHGTLKLGTTTGLTVTGNGTGSVSISGSLAVLDSALATLSYTPTSGYTGADTLSLSDKDSTDGLTAAASVAITVNA